MTTYVMGDIHGETARARDLLIEAKVMDEDGAWTAGRSTLWFIGDFFDRGSDGAGAIHLARRLQSEAPRHGGSVHALMGNHELMVLGVLRFGDSHPEFENLWLTNGGQPDDLARLSEDDRHWIQDLPAAGRVDDTLLIHCDSPFYARNARSLDDLNARVRDIVSDGPVEEFYDLMETFFSRFELSEDDGLNALLEAFSARRVIHGHTPIPIVLDSDPASVTEALVYSRGRCTNVDGGIYLGGPGFIHEVDA